MDEAPDREGELREGVSYFGVKIIPPDPIPALPPTWCVMKCEQGCDESWTIDVAEFSPKLTVVDVEEILMPLLIAHGVVEHDQW